MTEIEKQEDQPELDPVIMASYTMGQDLMGLVLQEIKALPDVWQKLSESKQGEVIDRVRLRVEDSVRTAVGMIAAEGMIKVQADIAGVAIKDRIVASLIVSRSNSPDAMNELFKAHNQTCLILLSGAEQFTGGMLDIVADKDQPQLPLDDGEGTEDTLYVDAVEFVRRTQKTSISSVQRELRIGYNRAARLVEKMSERGVLSEADGSGVRQLLPSQS